MLKALQHPGRLIPVLFAVLLTIGTVLLCLPISRMNPEEPANVLAAAFTAVSAACITGLSVVDTATYWTPFGQGVILALIQVGGFGIMTLATLVAILITGRLGLAQSLMAKSESHAVTLGDLRGIILTVGATMVAIEILIAGLLTARFYAAYDTSLWTALWHGTFHAVSAFNNAGFSLFSDNLMSFAGDPWVLGPICFAIIAGGVGFPVFYELRHRWRTPRTWSVHARVTILGYFGLLIAGSVFFGVSEWSNPGTLGSMSLWDRVMNSIVGGIMPRTAGFNSIDYGQATEETWAFDATMMFIGGGSAGTSGGIKVGTFVILAFVLWAEIRGEPDVVIGQRCVPYAVQREAITVALMAVGVVALGTLGLLTVTDHSLAKVLFEAASAFGTTGLSTGITGTLPGIGQIILMALMYIGRIGTISVASALALNTRHRHYRLPEERPIIG
ncbi:MAG: TrkH family potassium uptake protein [Actinomycetales bacterium]|nr:TrkH family potassium uptake protein [Actinomycetales bacterium]